MDSIGNIAGRMMEAWLLARAEALDAGRPFSVWAEKGTVAGKAREAAGERTAPREFPEACSDAPREEKMRGAASGSLSEAEVGDRPARAAGGRRRWD